MVLLETSQPSVNKKQNKTTIFIRIHFYLFLDENKIRAGKIGAIAIVVKAMNTHIDNTDLILQGCNTLINTTVNGKMTYILFRLKLIFIEENILAAGKARAIETIVKAINKHANNANICESAYRVLLNLVINGK